MLDRLADSLDAFVPQVLRITGAPGLSLAVEHRGETLERAYGWADLAARRPMATSTLFPAGSMTKLYDDFTADHRYEEWTRTIESLAHDAGLQGRRLLDVACGTGKSFLPFLERGYEVTACDISPAMASAARAKARGRARVSVQDMRQLPSLGTFDLICCLDDAVNYLHSAREVCAAFAGMARNLAPAGVMVFDANTLLAYRTFFATLSVIQREGQVLIWEGATPPDLSAGGLARATLEAYTAAEEGWTRTRSRHVQRHHPEAHVRTWLAAAGLEPVAVHGLQLDGSLSDAVDELVDTKALYVVRRAQAQRPGTGEPAAGTAAVA
jgi:SAM-dependent methyltransferase